MILEPVTAGRWIVPDQRVGQWVASRIPHVRSVDGFGQYRSLGIFDKADILAGVVFHDFNPVYRNCQVSMAADTPRWASRTVIAKLMAYPFEQLGCERVTTIIPARSARTLRFNHGIGFKMEGLCRKGFGDDDAVIMGLLKEDAPQWMLATPDEIA